MLVHRLMERVFPGSQPRQLVSQDAVLGLDGLTAAEIAEVAAKAQQRFEAGLAQALGSGSPGCKATSNKR